MVSLIFKSSQFTSLIDIRMCKEILKECILFDSSFEIVPVGLMSDATTVHNIMITTYTWYL